MPLLKKFCEIALLVFSSNTKITYLMISVMIDIYAFLQILLNYYNPIWLHFWSLIFISYTLIFIFQLSFKYLKKKIGVKANNEIVYFSLYLCKNIVFQAILVKFLSIKIDYFYANAIFCIILQSFLPKKLIMFSYILLLIALLDGAHEICSIYFLLYKLLFQWIHIQIFQLLLNLNRIKNMNEGIELFAKELPLPIYSHKKNMKLEYKNSYCNFIESNYSFSKLIPTAKLNKNKIAANNSEILNDNLVNIFHHFILYFETIEIKQNSEIHMEPINSPKNFYKLFNKIKLNNNSINNKKLHFIIFLSKIESNKNEISKIEIKNGLLLKTISHELRTPINGTLGGLAIMKNLIPNECLLYYNIAEKSTLLLLNTINCMVDYASINTDTFKINKSIFEVNNLLNELKILFNDKAKLSKIHFEIQNKLLWKCEISSDMDRIKQVLIQITQNAFQYTQRGFVCIECQHDLKSSIKFLVSDSGIGMTNNQINYIFEKNEEFIDYSGDRNNINMFCLGLKSSIKILDKLDSQLIIHSRIGEGTIVSFSISNLIISKKEERNTVEIFKSSINNKRLIKRKTCSILNYIPTTFEVVDLKDKRIKIFNKDYSKMQSVNVKINDKGNLSPMFHQQINSLEREEIPYEEDLKFNFISNSLNESIKSHVFKQTKQMDSGRKTINKKQCNNKLSFASLCEIIQHTSKSKFDKLDHIISVVKTTILIVDDEPFNRYILSEMILKHPDLEVIEASNGQIAVNTVKERQNRIKLIFMDLLMPIMDGYQATKLIKQFSIKNKFKIPIVAVTSFSADSEKSKCLEAGIDEFFNKPMTVEKLNKCLDKYIYFKEKDYD